MRVRIDTREFDRAAKQFSRELNRSMAGAINSTFSELHKSARDHVKVASKPEITRFGRSDIATGVAMRQLKGKFVKGVSAKQQVKDYIKRMIAAKRRAVRFSRLMVNAALIKSTGRSPQAPANVEAQGRKASNRGNYLNAWVRITYRFKSGQARKKNVEQVIQEAYDKASTGIGGRMKQSAERAIERAAKRAGLR